MWGDQISACAAISYCKKAKVFHLYLFFIVIGVRMRNAQPQPAATRRYLHTCSVLFVCMSVRYTPDVELCYNHQVIGVLISQFDTIFMPRFVELIIKAFIEWWRSKPPLLPRNNLP